MRWMFFFLDLLAFLCLWIWICISQMLTILPFTCHPLQLRIFAMLASIQAQYSSILSPKCKQTFWAKCGIIYRDTKNITEHNHCACMLANIAKILNWSGWHVNDIHMNAFWVVIMLWVHLSKEWRRLTSIEKTVYFLCICWLSHLCMYAWVYGCMYEFI